MFVAFIKPIAASILLAASGPQMPNYDIEQVCHSNSEVVWDHATRHECRHDERAARNDLQHQWLKIPLRYKEQCVQSLTGVDPSYVELSACIQSSLDLNGDGASSPHAAPGADIDPQ
jgi:hypothetical protein